MMRECTVRPAPCPVQRRASDPGCVTHRGPARGLRGTMSRDWDPRQSRLHCGADMTGAPPDRLISSDEDGIGAALEEATRAAGAGEVPVGAVVVLDGRIIGRGANCPISTHDPTAHAEIVALRAASLAQHNYRLTGATLYVTVEPCLMCVGALVHARVHRVVFGAPEPKAGALQSTQRAHEAPWLNHRLQVHGGVREADCRAVMQEFFRQRRHKPQMPSDECQPDADRVPAQAPDDEGADPVLYSRTPR